MWQTSWSKSGLIKQFEREVIQFSCYTFIDTWRRIAFLAITRIIISIHYIFLVIKWFSIAFHVLVYIFFYFLPTLSLYFSIFQFQPPPPSFELCLRMERRLARVFLYHIYISLSIYLYFLYQLSYAIFISKIYFTVSFEWSFRNYVIIFRNWSSLMTFSPSHIYFPSVYQLSFHCIVF